MFEQLILVIYILVLTSIDIRVYATDWCQVNAQIKEVVVHTTTILIYTGNLLAGTATSWVSYVYRPEVSSCFELNKFLSHVTGSGVLF